LKLPQNDINIRGSNASLNGIVFNAQPEAPAGCADAGASGWALNEVTAIT